MGAKLTYRELAQRLATEQPSPILDYLIAEKLGFSRPNQPDPPVTSSIDAARLHIVKYIFPGWMVRIAECCVSDDASLMPDYNDPLHGKRLQEQYEIAFWEQCPVDVDRRPSGQPAMALCQAAFEALALIEERGEPNPW